MGYVPVFGVNQALPAIEAAGEADIVAIMMLLSLALAERCDACPRIGGPSAGADAEAARFHARGLPVFTASRTSRQRDDASMRARRRT